MPKAPQPPDPHLWLEEREGEAALAWARERSAATHRKFAGPALEQDRKALLAAFDKPTAIPHIARRGRYVYNFWQAGRHVRGLWRRTTLASYRKAKPAWETLLDIDKLAKREKQDWVWKGAGSLPTDHSRAIVMLSRGGADAHELREYDLERRRFAPKGFYLPQAKGGFAWLDRDTLIVSRTLGGDADTHSGYPRTIRLWRRDTSFADAKVIFECQTSDMGCWPVVDHSGERPRILFWRRPDFFSSEIHLGGEHGPEVKLDLPLDIESADIEGDWLFVQLRSAWTPARRSYAAGSLLAIRLADFLAGKRNFAVLFRPTAKRVLMSFSGAASKLALSVLDDLRSRVLIASLGSRGWTIKPLAGLDESATITAWALDNQGQGRRDDFLVQTSTPLKPPTLWLARNGEKPARLKSAPMDFSARNLAVTRHVATSSDGARIPYWQVGPKALPKDGSARVLMEGYGGFNVPMLPAYRASTGIGWLAKGGVYVLACLRGGGEYGPAWHAAGRRAGKRLSHDDFAAIAADLVRRKLTRPARLACWGGSNGGLLVGNMLTRFPERFGAIVCSIPLLDMRRYTLLPAGASWIAEYGDPDKAEDWAFLEGLSPYHNLRLEPAYPPILITTSTRDDRVHPGHARKMAAALEAMGKQVQFHESEAGGHSGGTDNASRARNMALDFAFLHRMLGA